MATRTATAAPRPENTDRKGSEQVVDLPARITVNLPAKVWEALEESAKKEGISKTEALRRAVWVYLFFIDRIRSGSEIVIERPDGTTERVIFPY